MTSRWRRRVPKVVCLCTTLVIITWTWNSFIIDGSVRKPESLMLHKSHDILKKLSEESVTSVRPTSSLLINGNASSLSPYLYKMAKPGVFEALPEKFLEAYKSPCWMFKTETNRENLRCLPYFYILGMAKCGTTDLWEKLRKHPHVYSNVAKETHWWPYNRMKHVSFASYLHGRSAQMERLFKQNRGLRSRLITGDASPSTLFDNNKWRDIFGDRVEGPELVTADLLYAVQPNAKLIITLRDPTARLYSHYLYMNSDGTPEKFHQRTVECIARYRACRTNMSARACTYTNSIMNDKVTLLMGLYSVYVQDWFRVYPRHHFYIQRLEDWNGHCTDLLPKLHKFLELEPLSFEDIGRICRQFPKNSRKQKMRLVGHMLNETRVILRDFYSESNRNLSQLLKDNRFMWNENR